MPIKNKYSKEQKDSIISLYQENKSRSYISKILGINFKAVSNILKEAGFKLTNFSKKYSYHENIFNKIDTAEKAYWLGFITADGYILEKRHSLRIKLQGSDRNHVIKFANFIGANENAVHTEYHNITKKPLAKIEVCNKIIVNDLISYGIRQRKSTHETVVEVPNDLKRDYIRGLIDGDGSIRPDGTGISLNMSREVLMYVLNYFLDVFGIATVKIQDHDHTWKIEYRARKVVKQILSFLYYDNCVSLDRKFKLAKTICRSEISSQKSLND